MTQPVNNAQPAESPARRLGILYVASFSLIVVITAVNQALVLKELSRHTRATAAVGRLSTGHPLGRPLSLAALEVLAAGDPATRVALTESLRGAIQASRQHAAGTAPPGLVRSRRARPFVGPRRGGLGAG